MLSENDAAVVAAVLSAVVLLLLLQRGSLHAQPAGQCCCYKTFGLLHAPVLQLAAHLVGEVSANQHKGDVQSAALEEKLQVQERKPHNDV
jgi:hypothetical protein